MKNDNYIVVEPGAVIAKCAYLFHAMGIAEDLAKYGEPCVVVEDKGNNRYEYIDGYKIDEFDFQGVVEHEEDCTEANWEMYRLSGKSYRDILGNEIKQDTTIIK